MKSIPLKSGAQHSSSNSISQNQNFDNENITENVSSSLGNMHNADDTPQRADNIRPYSADGYPSKVDNGVDIGRNSTAYRVFKNIYDIGYHGSIQKTPANVYASFPS